MSHRGKVPGMAQEYRVSSLSVKTPNPTADRTRITCECRTVAAPKSLAGGMLGSRSLGIQADGRRQRILDVSPPPVAHALQSGQRRHRARKCSSGQISILKPEPSAIPTVHEIKSQEFTLGNTSFLQVSQVLRLCPRLRTRKNCFGGRGLEQHVCPPEKYSQ